MNRSFLRRLKVAALAALVVALTTALPLSAQQQPTENATPGSATSAPAQPISHTWKLKKLDGSVNVTINPDGTWIYSGGFNDKKKDQVFNITFAIKSKTGAIYLFHYEGDATNGVQFSKQGDSAILKDDFSSFSNHYWTAHYDFYLDSAGRKARWEAEQRKLEQIRKEEAEARKRHEEKIVAEKRREQQAEALAEAQWEVQYEQQHPSNNGGGGGGGSILKDVLNPLGAAADAITSLF